MLRSVLKLACRNLTGRRGYSFINIAGLTVGLACFTLILLFVRDEFSFDTFHSNAHRIYRLGDEMNENGSWLASAMTPAPMGPVMAEQFPEVERAARLMPWKAVLLSHDGKSLTQSVHLADAAVFDIFTFPLVRGNPQTILQGKFTAALSRSAALKFFGRQNPIGKSLTYNESFDLTVTGVFEDVPKNSHLRFDVLISLETFAAPEMAGAGALDSWTSHNFYTYLMLDETADSAVLAGKFSGFIQTHLGEDGVAQSRPFLESLQSIYLHSSSVFGPGVSGNINFVRAFIAIAILILFMAAVNFANLATAQSVRRAKEVGVRKVCGGGRSSLIVQFLAESVMLSMLSFGPAILLVEICLPTFNSLVHKNLAVDYFGEPGLMAVLFFVVLGVGLVSGAYPAFVLSSFEPVRALATRRSSSTRKLFLRRTLVTLQFVVTIALILVALTAHRQIHFLRGRDLGFDRENIIFIPIATPAMKQRLQAFKSEILTNPNILSAAATSRLLSNVYGNWWVKTPAVQEKIVTTTLFADEDVVETFGLRVVAGHGLMQEGTSDRGSAFLLNRKAVQKLGMGDPIGKPLNFSGVLQGNIVGILDDFNFQSLHAAVTPLVVAPMPSDDWKRYLAVKIGPGNIPLTIDFIRSTWLEFESGQAFEYQFLDSALDGLYSSEERFGKMVTWFTLLAVLVGAFGLFGLSSFIIAQRTKEIGVRKVLGASVHQVVGLVSLDFLRSVLLANIVAWPLAYLVISLWLDDFAYRVEIGWWTFFVAGGVAAAIALLTVGLQAITAALRNPVDSLRYE